MCELKENNSDLSWMCYIFTYAEFDSDFLITNTNDENNNYESSVNESEETEKPKKFNVETDEFCFPNFGSYISEGGNCAGIADYTTKLFNTGEFNIVDSYTNPDSKIINWNLSEYETSKTLSDRTINDFKSKDYFKNKYGDVIDKSELSGEDAEFIKMIGALWDKGNVNNREKGNEFKWFAENYDYEMIDDVIAKLDNNQICSVYIGTVTFHHAMNVYGYEYDKNNKNILYLKIYDNNFPNNKPINRETPDLRMKIIKKKSSSKVTFEFLYQPIKKTGKNYKASSYLNLKFGEIKKFAKSATNTYTMAFYDENGNNLSGDKFVLKEK